MGKELQDNYEAARKVFQEADQALGFSVSRLCFEGPMEDLTLTKTLSLQSLLRLLLPLLS